MLTSNYSMPDLARDVGKTFRVAQPDTLWNCGLYLSKFAALQGVADALNRQLERLGSDPNFIGEWSAHEVYLHREAGWNLSVAVLDVPQRYIHAMPELAFFLPLSSQGISAERYLLPASYKNELFDPAVKLEPAGTVRAAKGELLQLETNKYAYDFQIQEAITVVRLMTAPLCPLEWLFSKTTLQAWQANDADIAFTQLRVAAYVLGKIAHQSSVAPLKTLSSHPHHAVRWAAIQNLGRLNRSEALVKIREATNDPHPHVRRAAQKTLDQIEKKTTGR